jgi:hypothetical protein
VIHQAWEGGGERAVAPEVGVVVGCRVGYIVNGVGVVQGEFGFVEVGHDFCGGLGPGDAAEAVLFFAGGAGVLEGPGGVCFFFFESQSFDLNRHFVFKIWERMNPWVEKRKCWLATRKVGEGCCVVREFNEVVIKNLYPGASTC